MKPKAVIFSAGESLRIARDFANALTDIAECAVWKDLPFSLTDYTQRDLVTFGKQYDFALLVFGFEDKANIKGEDYNVTRDNVIYEFGLMSGLIGAERCLIIERLSGDKVLENRGFLYSPFWGFSKIPVFLCKRSCPAVGTPLFSSV